LKSKKIFAISRYSPPLDVGFCIFKKVPNNPFSFGIVVTKKIGCAVVRNRIKRRIKNALREAMYQIKQTQEIAIVAIARKESIKSDFSKMVSSIKQNIESSS